MGSPAATIGTMTMCPRVTPGIRPVPHVGGPIVGPGAPTVLIGGTPAAVFGDACACVGAPAAIIGGSLTVRIGGKQAVRINDQTSHGGTILGGTPSVLIGD